MTGSAATTSRSWRRGRPAFPRPGTRRRIVLARALIAVVTLAPVLVAGAWGSAARAAVPAPGQTRTGRATFYSLGDSGVGGNCSFPGEKLADHMYVAAGPEDYANSGGCGAYLDVTGPLGKIRVMIADKCPECESGHLDLSQEAFAKLGPLSAGIIPISYQTVSDPRLPGPLQVRVKEGSSQWWIAFLVMSHGNLLKSVEYRDSAGTWRALARQPYNYWLKSDGAGPGPFTLRMTDSAGHQAVASNIALSPMVTQTTNVWMYGSSGGSPTTAPATSATRTTAPVTTVPVTTVPVTTSPATTTSTSRTAAPVTTSTTARTATSTASTTARTATSTAGTTAAPATCQATVGLGSSWSGGYLAMVSVRNTGPAQTAWMVNWTMPGTASVVTGWNAAVTQRGRHVSAAAPAWKQTLASGGSLAIGIVVNGSSSSLPSAIKLGSTACQIV